MEYSEYNLKQTSSKTATFNDVILKSRKGKDERARKILSSQTIDNSIDPNDSLNIALIYQKAKEGEFDKNYVDLRKIDPGTSLRIRLDTAQTKQLFETLKDHYSISRQGVGRGKKIILSGIEDVGRIYIADDAVKAELTKKILSELSEDDLNNLLLKPENIKKLFSNLPKLRIDILESLKKELENKLSENEKAIQKWIDEEPKVRCLIFGLEFVDYKREVQFGNSRFDILTEQSGTDHVIIEMKSPNVEVFDEKITQLKNGVKKEFVLSSDLAEALPQTIKYFREYQSGNDETFQKVGTDKKIPHKAIIIIGRKKTDPIWQQHFYDLNSRISGIEILTYDHLIDKMNNQIINLKELSKLE